MAEADDNGVSARLLRLPGQLLLALINATAILVIVAAIVALVAIAHINRFAENVVAKMTEAVLSKVDLPQKDVLENIRTLTAEVSRLGNTLREIKTGEHPALQPELAQFKEALTLLRGSIDRLGSARSILTDEAIGQLGRTVTDALTKLRDCSSSARLVAPHTTAGNEIVEARALNFHGLPDRGAFEVGPANPTPHTITTFLTPTDVSALPEPAANSSQR